MALLVCRVCAAKRPVRVDAGVRLSTAGAGLHVLVGSYMDLGFYVHRERGSHVSGGQCVCAWSPLCVQVPIGLYSSCPQVCATCVWVCQCGEGTGVGKCPPCAVGLLYACRVPDTCGHQSVRGWGCPCVVGGTLYSQAPRPGTALPRAPRRPQGLTCFTCLPQLVGKAGSTAPRVGLARFLATSRNFRVTPTSGARVKGQA